MARVGDFFWREGWKVNSSDQCPNDFPLREGTMFLIGRPAAQASKGEGGQAPQGSRAVDPSEAAAAPKGAEAVEAGQYCIAWLDSSGFMRVDGLSFDGSRLEVTFDGLDYGLSAKVLPDQRPPRLNGTWHKKSGSRAVRQGQGQGQIEMRKDHSATGTWGAEGNGGGGQGGD